MQRIDVLIIDDAVLVRQMIADILQTDSTFRIVGIAEDGVTAVNSIPQIKPDIVLLDMHSTKFDSVGLLKKIRTEHPELPVIVLTTRTEVGAEIALNAIEMGAIDFITKTKTAGMLLFAENHLRKRLIPILKSSVTKSIPKSEKPEILALDEHKTSYRKQNQRTDIVVMGGCIGGAHSIMSFIPELPANFPIPVVIAQHMPKYYTRVMADKLDKVSKINVREGYAGAILEPGTVWIAPGSFHTIIQKRNGQKYLHVYRGPRENKCRPSIDVLFRSATNIYGRGVLGIILSGRGKDGVEGSNYIRSAGGYVMVQDPESSLVWEFPKHVVDKRYFDEVVPLKHMTEAIMMRTAIMRDFENVAKTADGHKQMNLKWPGNDSTGNNSDRSYLNFNYTSSV